MNEETKEQLRIELSNFINNFMTEKGCNMPSDSNFILDNEFEELSIKLEEYILMVHKTAIQEDDINE